MRAIVLVFLAFTGCYTVHPAPWVLSGPLTAEQTDQAQRIVAASKIVCPDANDYLKKGGKIIFAAGPYALDGACPVPVGYHVAGCDEPGRVDVLLDPTTGHGPDLTTTALAHELCHLGLEKGMTLASEGQANACAVLVHAEAAR
jgi:hypothetical protein